MTPVMILGPTASGKSAIAAELAQRFALEIISVDSAQVYRGMDIGTAKPDAQERARIPHHLIDIVEPEESYSAARFADDARALIAQITARGRLPLLVGGTMLYAKALRSGLHDLPRADPSIRRELDLQAERDGWPALHARLASIDPVTAARLAPADSQRIQRALEVWMVSAKPLSVWLAEHERATLTDLPMICIALEPSDRSVLHERIATRFEAMLDLGLIDEVERLRTRPGLHATMPSMRSVGYRQVWEWLEQPSSLATLMERGIAATRQLAKRQLTWLRSDPDRIVIDCLAADRAKRVADIVDAAMAREVEVRQVQAR